MDQSLSSCFHIHTIHPERLHVSILCFLTWKKSAGRPSTTSRGVSCMNNEWWCPTSSELISWKQNAQSVTAFQSCFVLFLYCGVDLFECTHYWYQHIDHSRIRLICQSALCNILQISYHVPLFSANLSKATEKYPLDSLLTCMNTNPTDVWMQRSEEGTEAILLTSMSEAF